MKIRFFDEQLYKRKISYVIVKLNIGGKSTLTGETVAQTISRRVSGVRGRLMRAAAATRLDGMRGHMPRKHDRPLPCARKSGEICSKMPGDISRLSIARIGTATAAASPL